MGKLLSSFFLLLSANSLSVAATWEPRQAEVNHQTVTNLLDQAQAKADKEKDSSSATALRIFDQAKSLATSAQREGQILASQLKYGKHNVSSSDGESIILAVQTLLRKKKTDTAEFDDSLRIFKEALLQGKPEAIVALGFFTQYGLVGQQPNQAKAFQLYKQASDQGDIAATYNIGISHLYGTTGRQDLAAALETFVPLVRRANDTSGRLCGIGSFAAYKASDSATALNLAKGCSSSLASLSIAAFDASNSTQKRFDLAKQSLSSGLNDGINIMISSSKQAIANDPQFLYCKSFYLKQALQTGSSPSRESVSSCIEYTIRQNKGTPIPINDYSANSSIIGFVNQTKAEIIASRKANQLHYAWSIPFFPLSRADLIEMEGQIK